MQEQTFKFGLGGGKSIQSTPGNKASILTWFDSKKTYDFAFERYIQNAMLTLI